MSTLSKLLQEKVSKDPIFFLSTYLSNSTTDRILADRFIGLFIPKTDMDINQKLFIQCLKGRNPKTVQIDSLTMLKDHYFYDEIDTVDFRGPDPIQEENTESELSVKCLKRRPLNDPTIVFYPLNMFKDYINYCSGSLPIEYFDPDPIEEEDPELTPGPKAEFKKTPLESLKKKKMVQAVSPSPLLKGLLGTK